MDQLESIKNTLLSNKLPIKFIEGIVKVLEIIIKEDTSNIVSAIGLFGSVARGTYKITSDIDIFIIYSSDYSNASEFTFIIKNLINSIEFVSCDLVGCYLEDIKEPKNLLFKQINKEGLILWRNQKIHTME